MPLALCLLLTSDNFGAHFRYMSENQVLVHTNSEESCTKIWRTAGNRRIFAISKRNNETENNKVLTIKI
jgi:hypothetical protein